MGKDYSERRRGADVARARVGRLTLALAALLVLALSNPSVAAAPTSPSSRAASASDEGGAPGAAQLGRRVALVIGNSKYSRVSDLGGKPINDAHDVSLALRGFGFEVLELLDGDKAQMEEKLTEFSQKIDGASAALVFYAGHAAQLRNENYLMPVNVNVNTEAAIRADSISLSRVLDELEGAKNRINIVMLDACRNNPVTGKFRDARNGLAAPSVAPKGTVIVYATEPGNLAENGSGRNGVFTAGLLKAFGGKDLSLDAVLTVASEEVERTTERRQTPYVNGPKTVQKQFQFRVTVDPGPQQLESEIWATAQKQNTVAAYELYKKRYPKGAYADFADLAIAGLRPQTPAAPIVQAAPVVPPVVVAIAPAQPPSVEAHAAAAAPAATGAPRAGEIFKDCADCPELVVIPAGSLMMGSNVYYSEQPPHSVSIKSFALGKTEVTQGQWKAVMGRNPSYYTECGDTCPVASVSWDDAQEFVERLNAKTGKQYRLPSESEWEYAARGGTTTKWSFGDNESALVDYGWYGGNSEGKTHAVGQKRANPYGLHDMHGNVYEWVEDCWHDNYVGAPTDGSAWTTGCGGTTRRVRRGGSWGNDPVGLRSADRYGNPPAFRDSVNGFRIARTF